MRPQKFEAKPQHELFRMELERIIDVKHPLVKLAKQIDWETFEKHFEKYFKDEGRPAIETRLMVSLHYLKYAFNLSDEDVVAKWVENPYWQYLSGRQYFEHEFPIDPSSMVRWRKRVGVNGAEQLLGETIRTGIEEGHIKSSELTRVNVDTTVQTKAIQFPTDARLYNRMRQRLVTAARDEGVTLRQSYERVGVQTLRRQQNYAHAQQFRRARRETKRLKTLLGRVVRDIERKAVDRSTGMQSQLTLARRILAQERHSKNKIYSIHEPQVQCIAKGKVHRQYEFGCKVGFVVSAKGNWILGAKAFSGNPYDGHTLKKSLTQAERLTKVKIEQAVCDQGYRGHGIDDCKVLIVPRRKNHASRVIRRWWRRRNAIEPIIGHEKSDHRLERNHLSGELGDKLNAIFSACGFNIKKLLRAFWPQLQNWLDCLLGLNLQTKFS
jgi:IS5 family transposase